jgi:hypothetical protein
MQISEIISGFGIYTTNEEGKILQHMNDPQHLLTYNDHDQVIIERMIRKGLVIKIGNTNNPIVVKNEL